MGALTTLDINQLAGVAVLLLEALVIALVVLAVLAVRHRRLRRELAEARRSLKSSRGSLANHKAFVKKAHSTLHEIFQRRGLAEPDHGIEARADEPGATPEYLLLALWKSLLALEGRALTAPAKTFWQDRTEALGRHLRGWRAALERIQASERGQVAEPAAEPVEPTASRVHPDERLQEEVRKLRARVEELQAYKRHFGELHAHALEERRANRALREQLHHAFSQARPQQVVQQAVADYDSRRGGVDGFLDRADVEPLSLRAGAPPTVATPAWDQSVSARQQAVIDQSGDRVQREYRNLQSTIDQQRHLIGELKDKIAQAEFDREQMRQYYTARVTKLERTNEQTQQSLNVLETENTRQHRQIRRLTRKLKEHRDRSAEREAMEATIDRFAAQAVEMQSRIAELEAELHGRETAALTSEETAPAPADGTGADDPAQRS